MRPKTMIELGTLLSRPVLDGNFQILLYQNFQLFPAFRIDFRADNFFGVLLITLPICTLWAVRHTSVMSLAHTLYLWAGSSLSRSMANQVVVRRLSLPALRITNSDQTTSGMFASAVLAVAVKHSALFAVVFVSEIEVWYSSNSQWHVYWESRVLAQWSLVSNCKPFETRAASCKV